MLEILLRDPNNTQAVVAVIGLFISVFTILLLVLNAAFMGWQSWSLRTTIIDGRTREERELRAYVHIEKIGVEVPITKAQAILEIRNFGRLPSKGISVRCKTEFLPQDANPSISMDVIPQTIGAIGPGSTWNCISETESTITVDQLRDWKAKTMKVFTYGRIDYRDSFSPSRITFFQFSCGNDSYTMTFPNGVKKAAMNITDNPGKNDST